LTPVHTKPSNPALSFPVDVPLNVSFLKHTLELADVEAVFAVTMFLSATASQSLELTALPRSV
jgi:hypothetical protein